MENISRQFKHFWKSMSFVIGIEHFVVMFPSILLVSRLSIRGGNQPLLPISTIFLGCGIGTLIVIYRRKRSKKSRLPLILGPSFAYIGLTSYLLSSFSTSEDPRSYVIWGYCFSAILLLIIGTAYKLKPKLFRRFLDFIFPTSVMGAAVSLIGLELAYLAVEDVGLDLDPINIKSLFIALITLIVIILLSVIRNPLKNAAITIGIITGCVIMIAWNQNSSEAQSFIAFDNGFLSSFRIPDIKWGIFGVPFPKDDWLSILLAIVPSTLVAFSETIGRLTVLEGMISRYEKNGDDKKSKDNKLRSDATLYHGISVATSAVIGTVPTAYYAENLAVMSLHADSMAEKREKMLPNGELSATAKLIEPFYNELSIVPYYVAAILAISAAFCTIFENIVSIIPSPVYGGMELFIFALISAPGVQMLVDEYVNYKKITNQILTGSVLLAGVSNISFQLGAVTIRGMSLGLFIGVIFNFIFKILEKCGLLCERPTIYELFTWYNYLGKYHV